MEKKISSRNKGEMKAFKTKFKVLITRPLLGKKLKFCRQKENYTRQELVYTHTKIKSAGTDQ